MSNQISLSQYRQLMANKVSFQKVHRSRIYLGATVTDGDGDATMAYAAGSYYAFGYGQGDAIEGVANGSAPTTKATAADTTILKARTPPNGERVAVFGVSVRQYADSDPFLAALLDKHLRFALRLNSREIVDLGTLGDLGGLSAGMSWLLEGPADVAAYKTGALYTPCGAQEKGIFFRDPIIWTPSEGADGNLDVLAQIHSAVTVTVADRSAEASTSEVGHTVPTTAGNRGTFVDLQVRLHCETMSDRGYNV